MRKSVMGLVGTGVAASLVVGGCSSSSKSPSAAAPTPSVATSAASTKVCTLTSPNSGSSVVSVAPAARSDRRAGAVEALLTRRFTDIKERNFADYWAMYTPKYRATFNRAEVEAGYRSSEVCDVHLTELSTSGDGRAAATVTFTSMQDAANGPNGETCTHWKVGFFLKKVGAAYLIDSVPPTYHAKYPPC
jgi:uncharacterized protein YchJ